MIQPASDAQFMIAQGRLVQNLGQGSQELGLGGAFVLPATASWPSFIRPATSSRTLATRWRSKC